MLKSILITSLRNLMRNQSFSLINLIGLSVSMSLSLLIIIIVKEQYGFDKFHSDVDRIYRVNTRALRVDGGAEPYASAPVALGRAIKEQYSFTEEVVVFTEQLRRDVTFENTTVPVSGFIADPSFLTMFNFPLAKGNPANALSEPNSLVLTQESVDKIFGKNEALGQTVTLNGFGEFTVTGVLDKIPGQTHLDFEALLSTRAIPGLEAMGAIRKTTNDWNNYYSGFVYFKLAEGRTTEEVDRALNEIAKTQYANLQLETRDKGYEFYLQPLSAITPGPELSNNLGRGMPDMVLIFMGSLAIIVMIMSCFNYTNLMIAKSLSRAREIGIRKVVGGHRWQVFLQFVGESVVFSFISLVFSYLLYQLIKPGFSQLHIMQEFSNVNMEENLEVYMLFVLFAVMVGIVAGLLPAAYLSAFKPIAVLKDTSNLKVYSRLTFRKVLMIIQFTFSLVFILYVIVVYKQVQYMVSADYGFNEKNIVNVRLQGVPYANLAASVSGMAEVERVGAVSHRLGTWDDGASDYKRFREDKPFVMRDFSVNANYISNLQLNFVAGKTFSKDNEGRESEVILNETALKNFGFDTAPDAVGQTIYADDSLELKVIGVVKDFHFRPMTYQLGPLALRNNPENYSILSAKLTSDDIPGFITKLEPVWKAHDTTHALDWASMESQIDNAYTDAGFKDIYLIVGYISFVAVCLACLGMLGMAMYSAQTRTKEIGVRKVMGASVTDVVILLSRSFMVLISIAIVVGVPIGYFLSDLFLNRYAYKIEITPGIILSGVFFLALLGALTISSQTLKAAVTNPVKALRYE